MVDPPRSHFGPSFDSFMCFVVLLLLLLPKHVVLACEAKLVSDEESHCCII